jgi:hypothetical protein
MSHPTPSLANVFRQKLYTSLECLTLPPIPNEALLNCKRNAAISPIRKKMCD